MLFTNYAVTCRLSVIKVSIQRVIHYLLILSNLTIMAIKKMRRTQVPLRKNTQVLKNRNQEKQQIKVNVMNKKTLIIAQEIKFARLLASNDKKVRDKIVKNLKKWLTVRSKSSFAFTEADFMRLWKGLFYCMWMSDKPLIQEELAESLSKIVFCFELMNSQLLYTQCALKTLSTEWFGIDQYRLDKFGMLARRILRQTFLISKNNMWSNQCTRAISQIFEKLLLDPQSCLGFKMHFTELYLEELAKVSEGTVPGNIVNEFVKPFLAYLATLDDETHIKHIMKHIFRYLIFQSDIGIEYTQKFEAWKKAGFPTGSINAMQKVEQSTEDFNISDDEEQVLQTDVSYAMDKSLDPRAGRVNVELPQLNFDAQEIVETLKQHRFHTSVTTIARRQIARLIKEFTEISLGTMPLGIQEIKIHKINDRIPSSKRAAMDFFKFEEELYSDMKKNKHKRKKCDVHTNDDSQNELCDLVYNSSEAVIDAKQNPKHKMNIQYTKNENENPSNTHTLVQTAKKKVGRSEIKTILNNKLETQYSSSESSGKPGVTKLLSDYVNKKSKKCKIKHKDHIMNSQKNLALTKLKKLKKYSSCGSWDVSDSTDPAIASKEETQLLNGVSANPKMDNADNALPKETVLNNHVTWLTPVVQKLDKNALADNEILKTGHLSILLGIGLFYNLMSIAFGGGEPTGWWRYEGPLRFFKCEDTFLASIKICKVSSSLNNHVKLKKGANSKKRVKIVLHRNTAQHTSEYLQQIRQSPAIPFDANKKPLAGVLKASPIPSPVNPFYKRSLK